jgi:hypothetical protein
LPVSRPITIDYPDWQQDYESVCQDRVFYALLPIKHSKRAAYLKNLAKIENFGLYGSYTRALNTVSDFTAVREGRLMEKMAKFIRSYHFHSDPRLSKEIILPKNIDDALKGEVIQAIWIEGVTRITNSGLPLVIGDVVAPIAIKTNRGLYGGVEVRMPKVEGGCYVSKPFSNKVIDLSICAGDMPCARNVLNTLLRALKTSFTASPIGAEEIVNEEFAPGEFALKRERRPSEILGPPYYEISTYTVETWIADSENPWGSLYGRQTFKGLSEDRTNKAKDHLLLFLKVSHVLTTSVHRNGKYFEPATNEVAKFESVISKTTKDAVSTACEKLKGRIDSGVCALTAMQEK